MLLCAALALASGCEGCGAETPDGTPDGGGGAGFGEPCSGDADCASGLGCYAGACAECAVDGDCAGDRVCQRGRCVVGCAEDDRCELGGTCCPGDDDCVDRVCRPPCAGSRCGRHGEICCEQGEICEADRCVVDCAGTERCGRDLDVCCQAGEICYGFSCTQPGDLCILQSDCLPGQVCEVDLGVCIDATVVGSCEYHPPTGVFTPAVECRWQAPADQVTPDRVDVVMTPVVANLTDDNGDGVTDLFDIPDLVFSSYDFSVSCCNEPATLRVVRGSCNPDGSMTTLASIDDPPLDNSGGIALGDLSGDGVPEIVAIQIDGNHPDGTVAFRRATDDGSAWAIYWRNDDYPTWNVHTRGGAQPSIADLDGDGAPEVIVGNVVLNGQDGTLLWDGVVESAGLGGIGNNAFLGPVSTVADLDRDGAPEVLAGNTRYAGDGSVLWTYPFTTENSSCNGQLPCDGFTAVANFDADDDGELVIVRLGEIFVLDPDMTLLFQAQIPIDDCFDDTSGAAMNEAGPPTVADFDGDGRPEIGSAAADFYVVADLDCVGDPPPAGCAADGILWTVPNFDCSSRVTASSVFDFEGDGVAEVVYADERTFRILDGRDGSELYVDSTHRSHTRVEMAVIADVDNDGNAEVVIAENRSGSGTPGVVIWGDAADNWVFTRRVWNQHSYHVTNVSETGLVPAQETANWLAPHLNNFRQNTQGEGLFWAPDLVVTNLSAVCEPDLSAYITFDVMNQGSRMVGPGVPVSIYIDGVLQTTLPTTRSLLPGQLEFFSWIWPVPEAQYNLPLEIRVVADDRGDGTGLHNECDNGGEDNNAATINAFMCGPEN